MHNTLGDFKCSAYSWNPKAGDLYQGKHIGGKPVHEHRRREMDGNGQDCQGHHSEDISHPLKVRTLDTCLST